MRIKIRQLLLTLSSITYSLSIFAQSSDRERIQNMLSAPKIRQSRTHIVTAEFGHQTIRNQSDSEDSTLLVQTFGIGYGHNFVLFEVGGHLHQLETENQDSGEKNSAFKTELYGRYNVIRNIPEESIIPYVQMGLGQYSGFKEASQNKLSGPITTLALGLDWYPFREYVALGLELKQDTHDLKLTGDNSDQVKIVDSGASLHYRLVF